MANKNQSPTYSPKIRHKWYFLVNSLGKTVIEVCGLYSISRKTYYKWKNIDLGSREYVPKQEHPQTKIKGDVRKFITGASRPNTTNIFRTSGEKNHLRFWFLLWYFYNA